MSVRAVRAARGRRPVASAPVAALAGLPAGPELAAALAGLDPRSLTGFETVLVVKAWNRLNNYARGMLVAAVGEVMLRKDPGYGRFEPDPEAPYGGWTPDEVGASEIRTALWLTRRSANKLCALAGDLMVRLPAVREAMICGRLDQARATIFSLWTAELCDPHARAVVAALLPIAHQLTTAQLIERIQKAAIELDPQWARRRYENGLKARDVKGTINPDGTAELTGNRLPADEVAAACDRIDALAQRVKQAGHWWPLRWIRADIFLGRNSKYVGYTDEQLLTHLLASMPPQPAPDDDTRSTIDDTAGGSTAGGDEPDEPEGPGAGGGDPQPPDVPPPGPADASADDDSTMDDAAAGGSTAGGRVNGSRRGLRLLVGLGTIAGLDERPGDLLGFGLVHADLARRVSAAPHAAWYIALTSADGTPIDIGPIRRRPTTPWANTPTLGASGVELWLQLSTAELDQLRQHPPPGWQAIITTLTQRLANRAGGPPNGDPTDRIPADTLRRWVNIRDRRCVFPTCRIAPHKHGWRLTQPTPGRFIWTSPLGHQYERTMPPGPEQVLTAMPEPTPPHHDWWHHHPNTGADDNGPDSCKDIIPPPPPPKPQPPPPPKPQPKPHNPADDIPPF